MFSPVSNSAEILLARLDRVPLTRVHRSIIGILAALFFFDFGDQFVLAGVAPALLKWWHLRISDIGSLNAATFLGMAVGAFLGGWIADRVGRKRALLWITLWVCVFSLLNALVWNLSIFLVLRFLVGLGLTAVTSIGSAYVAEMFPPSQRGKIQGWIMVVAFVGTVAINLLGVLIIPLSPLAWRWMFGYGVVAALVLVAFPLLPESPRWLVKHQRTAQAEEIVTRFEEAARQQGSELAPVVVMSPSASTNQTFSLRQLFQGRYLGRTFFVGFLLLFVTLGVLGFVTWVPTLLSQRGFSLTNTLIINLLIGLAAPLGAFFSSVVAERFERKQTIALACLLIAIFLWLYGLSSQAVLIVIFGFLATMLFQGLSPILFSYAAELFPTQARATGFGLTYGFSRFCNVISPFLITFFFARGYLPVFGYLTGCWLLALLLVVIFGIRTKMQSLEYINPEEARASHSSP